MMDWGLVISGLLGIVSGGTLTGVMLRKQTKGSATADALDKYADAMSAVLENTTKQQEVFNKIIDDKDRSIGERDSIIEANRETMEELRAQIQELRLKVAENERKVVGMQKTIDNEIRLRKTAENNICFVADCKLRKPKLGTYKKEAWEQAKMGLTWSRGTRGCASQPTSARQGSRQSGMGTSKT